MRCFHWKILYLRCVPVTHHTSCSPAAALKSSAGPVCLQRGVPLIHCSTVAPGCECASVCSALQAEVHTSVKTLLGMTSLFVDAPCLFVMFLLLFLPLLRIKVSFSRKLLVSFYLGLVVTTTRVLVQSCSSCQPSREPPALTSCTVWSSSRSASGGRGYSSAADSIGPASERAVGERCCSNHSSRCHDDAAHLHIAVLVSANWIQPSLRVRSSS